MSDRLILQQILTRLLSLERLVEQLAADVDTIDRTLRPYGDGWKPQRRRAA